MAFALGYGNKLLGTGCPGTSCPREQVVLGNELSGNMLSGNELSGNVFSGNGNELSLGPNCPRAYNVLGHVGLRLTTELLYLDL